MEMFPRVQSQGLFDPDAVMPQSPLSPADFVAATKAVRRLRPTTQLGLIALLLVLVGLTSWHWQFLLGFPLLLVVTLGQLVRWWHSHYEFCPLDDAARWYLFGLFALGLLLMGAALALSSLVSTAASPLLVFLFWQLPKWHLRGKKLRDTMTRVGQVVSVAVRWTSFTFFEEVCLLWTLRRAKARLAGEEPRKFQLYATSSAIGYCAAQCVALASMVIAILENQEGFFETKAEHRNEPNEVSGKAFVWLIFLAFFFTMFWLPLRLASSHLTALEFLHRPADVSSGSFFPLPAPDASEDDECHAPNPCGPPMAQEDEPSSSRMARTAYSGFNSRRRRRRRRETQKRVLLCARFWHLQSLIQWSWLLRSLHMTQFSAWFYVLAIPINSANVISWLVITFIFWVLICSLAYYRVARREGEKEHNDEATICAVYGFVFAPSIKQDDDDDDDDELSESLLENDHLPPARPNDFGAEPAIELPMHSSGGGAPLVVQQQAYC